MIPGRRALSTCRLHRPFPRSRHDPGRVLVDLAVAATDGAECVSDIAVLSGQAELRPIATRRPARVPALPSSGRRRQRIHDLRHSFTVAILLASYGASIDVAGSPAAVVHLPRTRRPEIHLLVARERVT